MGERMNLGERISRGEARKARGVSGASVPELVRRGRPHTMEIGGDTFVNRGEVECFEPQRGGARQKEWMRMARKKRGSRQVS